MGIKIGMPTLMEFNSVKENLDVCKELGLDFLELNINMLYCTPDEEFRNMLIEYKGEYNIDFTMHYYDTVDVSSTSRYYRNYLYTAFSEIGKYLEGVVEKIVIHLEPGAYMTIRSEKKYVYANDDTYVSRTLNTLQTIREILHTFGIRVVVENVPIHPFMEDAFKVLNENGFMFCYDIGHNVIYNDGLFEIFRQKHNLFVSHMHMHNVIGKHDHQELGHGDLDIDYYIEFAKKNNIDIVIEVKDLENLRKSVDFIKKRL
jgi:sugar phosphate isomerase/epimerase